MAKQITITLSDELAAAVEAQAGVEGRSAEDIAAEAVETVYLSEDWFDRLDDEAKAAVMEGRAQLERGEGIPHDKVVEELWRKRGW